MRAARLLDPSGGQVHYDRPGTVLSVVKRQVDGQHIRFEEKGGGKFDGACGAKTGEVTGSYMLKGKTKSFELSECSSTLHLSARQSRTSRSAGADAPLTPRRG